MIYLRSEPSGEGYRALLRFLAGHCDSFELVLRRKGLEPAAQAKAVIAALESFEMSRTEATQWSGTELGEGAGTALLGRYRLTDQSLQLLMQRDALYEWRLPRLPEDLSFFTKDGSRFFSSTAHEKESMLGSGSVSSEEFQKANPTVNFTWYPGART